MKWISVKEALPIKEGDYLCYLKGFGQRIRIFEKRGTISSRFWINKVEDAHVTHWMHLPKDPVDSRLW